MVFFSGDMAVLPLWFVEAPEVEDPKYIPCIESLKDTEVLVPIPVARIVGFYLKGTERGNDLLKLELLSIAYFIFASSEKNLRYDSKAGLTRASATSFDLYDVIIDGSSDAFARFRIPVIATEINHDTKNKRK